MTFEEVVERGQAHCRSRGYECVLKEAYRPRRDVWKVRFGASTGSADGPVQLEFHAFTQELLHTSERLEERDKGLRFSGPERKRREEGHVHQAGHAH